MVPGRLFGFSYVLWPLEFDELDFDAHLKILSLVAKWSASLACACCHRWVLDRDQWFLWGRGRNAKYAICCGVGSEVMVTCDAFDVVCKSKVLSWKIHRNSPDYNWYAAADTRRNISNIVGAKPGHGCVRKGFCLSPGKNRTCSHVLEG